GHPLKSVSGFVQPASGMVAPTLPGGVHPVIQRLSAQSSPLPAMTVSRPVSQAPRDVFSAAEETESATPGWGRVALGALAGVKAFTGVAAACPPPPTVSTTRSEGRIQAAVQDLASRMASSRAGSVRLDSEALARSVLDAVRSEGA